MEVLLWCESHEIVSRTISLLSAKLKPLKRLNCFAGSVGRNPNKTIVPPKRKIYVCETMFR
jgi:hypothetical protein